MKYIENSSKWSSIWISGVGAFVRSPVQDSVADSVMESVRASASDFIFHPISDFFNDIDWYSIGYHIKDNT